MDQQERERFLRYLALGVAEDESLYAHDRRFHPDGYNGGRCLYRAKMGAGDPSDALLVGSQRGKSAPRTRGGAAPSAPWEREYAEVIARYTNPDGSHKKGWLCAPNGKPSKLVSSFEKKEDGIRAWVQVRTPSFKKWFGDWEKSYSTNNWYDVQPARTFREMPEVDISDIAPLPDKASLKNAFERFGNVVNNSDGTTVRFPAESAGRFVFVRNHAGAFKRLFETSRLAWREKEKKFEGHKEHPNIESYSHYINKFTDGDKNYYVRFTVRSGRDEASEGKNLVHAAKVSRVEIYECNDESTQTVNIDRSEDSSDARRFPHDFDYKIAYFLSGVNPGNEDCSRIVDSNGEPMVCWHGSPDNTFDRFDKRKIHPKDGIRAFFFATPERRDSMAGFYGEGKERPFFLNIRNALTLDPDTQPKSLKGVDGIIRVYAHNDVWKPRYFNYRTDKEETERIKKGDVLEIQVFEPNQIKSANGNSGEFSPRKETVMDQKIDLKKIAQMAIAEDAASDNTTLDVVLEVLQKEGDEPRRAPYPKTRPVPPPTKSPAQDAAPDDESPTSMASDLQKHDKRFHPQGYKEGDSCKFREALAKGDKSDVALAAAESAESRGNLSSKKHAEYLRLMQKKHPELDAEAVLAEVGKIGDKKIQADAFAWVLRGAVRLPEDLYKVEQARELATKAKVDPFTYNTPQACINDLLGQGHKVSLKPITVEELKKDPLFSDYKKLPAGVETFEVEDSREGQRRMREVIDTHWGKDANPWCLLARKEKEAWERSNDREEYEKSEEWWRSQTPPEREEIAAKIFKKDTSRDIIDDFVNCESIVDADGAEDYYYKNVAEPVDDLENAWDYWNHYNALPKRVAFKDGKLLAFMATDSLDEESAFDDAAYGSASKLSEIYPDEFKEYEEWEESDEGREEGANFYEWLEHNYPELTTDEGLREHTPEEWWDRTDSPHKGIPLGNMAVPGDKFGRWADLEIRDGNAVPASKFQKGDDAYKDGYVSWYDNGQKEVERKDGKLSEWYENGGLKSKTLDDMTAGFSADGRISLLKNYGVKPERSPMVVSLWDDGSPASISIKLYNAFAPGGRGDANLVLRRDGTLSPDSTLSPVMSEKEIRAKADALIAEAKRRFPQGGKTPVKDTSPFPEKAFQKWLEKQG